MAETYLDFGVRVQKSVFECWLDEERFEELWQKLGAIADPESDALHAYALDAAAARRRHAFGKRAELTERRSRFIY